MASMRHVLQALAAHQAEWLRKISLPHWFSRYVAPNRRPILTECIQHQDTIGADMAFLLEAITRADMPQLDALNDVQEFYRVWSEQFDPICLEGVKLYPYCYFCGSPQSFETCRTGDSLP
jgi:hypothetical protein